ncbi:MAG: LacI family DNA-binding transcriptional regulator [Terriglobia bacterium]
MRGKPTLRQLAETAGVSLATVSRIVNGSARVEGELHDRIFSFADEVDRVLPLKYSLFSA